MRVVGVDIGGTFTDFMLYDTESGSVHVHKVPSTPDEPERAMVGGLAELCTNAGLSASDVTGVFHGTTVATNAVLEHKGALAGMITTRGFRDVVHIGRHQRPLHYSVMQDIPWQARPFVRRRHRKVVTERIVPPTGEVLAPLDEDEVRAAARELRDEGRRGRGGVLPLLLPEPRARAARGGDRPRGAAGRVRDDERGHRSAVPGVRALHDRDPECVRRADDRDVSRPARSGTRRGGRGGRAARDDVERRRCKRAVGRRAPGHLAALGPCGRNSRRPVGRRAADHVRHGRHLGGHRHRHRGRRRRSLGPRHLDRRVPAARADARRACDRRRGRLDRLRRRGRRVPRRAAERRCGPGPRLLRARRNGTDDQRRPHRARAARSRAVPRRAHEARPGRRGRRRPAARRPAGARAGGDGRGDPDDRELEHGPRDPLADDREGTRPA